MCNSIYSPPFLSRLLPSDHCRDHWHTQSKTRQTFLAGKSFSARVKPDVRTERTDLDPAPEFSSSNLIHGFNEPPFPLFSFQPLWTFPCADQLELRDKDAFVSYLGFCPARWSRYRGGKWPSWGSLTWFPFSSTHRDACRRDVSPYSFRRADLRPGNPLALLTAGSSLDLCRRFGIRHTWAGGGSREKS